jgi:hypothetical protein
MMSVSLLISWLTCGLLKPVEPPSSFVAHTNCPSAVLVEFHNNNDSVMRVVGYFGLLLCTQGTFCVKPGGIILVESTQIRWFSR